ncbi:MAG: glucose-6-phosphate isomerase [Proteobacteria bacterium]|nr:glucose-6-phosphate isomerase [Pseudomonadota bacterium]
MSTLTKLSSWQKLCAHYRAIGEKSMDSWFAEDPQRFKNFSLETAGIFLDYSKNRISSETMQLLLELAGQQQLQQRIDDLLSGKIVNHSEHRPALHSALRNSGSDPILVDGVDVMPAVRQTLNKVYELATAVRSRQYLGFSGRPIETILHFGIGGSDLGTLMAFEALAEYRETSLRYHFFSHQDPLYVQKMLAGYDPATTLIIIASKSFTTTETLVNAEVARKWLIAVAPNEQAALKQMFAVTAQINKALQYGLPESQILPIWDWVGGRYSVWSAMSFVVVIAIGPERFSEFLAGAESMDHHFKQAPLKANMPAILGLLDVWYNNLFCSASRAIIPYARQLKFLPDHLQQVYMESLGKRVNQTGQTIDCETGYVIWGGTGTNTQHSFHQLLLQGTRWIPIDFILVMENLPLVANGLAQSQVLMTGYTPAENSEGLSSQQTISGNRPSHTFLLDNITPYSLGTLLATYEHRIFVNSVIWDINAFDQWGVERGKILAKQILSDITQGPNVMHSYDNSTAGLLSCVKEKMKRI